MIKWFIKILFLLPASCILLPAQINLVPNASFEVYSTCPDNISGIGDDQLSRATGWITYSETCDYFNSCGTIWNVSVPNNQPGYQTAHTGNGYAGVVTFQGASQYREIAGCQLLSPLVIGQKYFLSFYASLGGKMGSSMASNKLGSRLSTLPYSYSAPSPINNYAHIFSDSIITDTSSWTLISGSFLADSAYQYISVGNFFDDLNTDTQSVNQFPFVAYYYIDDLCLTTDSLYALNWTSVTEALKVKERNYFFPNPSSSAIHFNLAELTAPVFIEVCDFNNKSIRYEAIGTGGEMDVSNLSDGVYNLHIIDKHTVISKVLIKN